MASCDIPELDLLGDFEAPAFQNTPVIRWMHDTAPRFGHSNDLTLFMNGSEEEQADYLKGLVAFSIAMLVFFLLWMLILLAFRCMGPSEVGFLSGRPKTLPPRPTVSNHEDDGELKKWQESYEHARRRLRIYRSVVIFCGCAIVLSSIFMSVHGVSNLTESVKEGQDSILLARKLARQGIKLIDLVTDQTLETSSVVREILGDVNSICPTVRDPICKDLEDVSTCNFEGIFDEESYADIAENSVTALQQVQSSEESQYFQEILEARDGLSELLKASQEADESAEALHEALYKYTVIFSWLLAILCISIVVGLICRMSNFLTYLRHYALVPVFSTLVCLSFICSIVFLICSMAAADLCVDSPDEQTLATLNQFQDKLPPVGASFASFYIQECPPSLIPEEVSTQLDYFAQAIPALDSFTSLVADSSATMNDVCGFDESSRLSLLAETANGQFCRVSHILELVQVYFQCSNWFPLYSNTMYQAVCYQGADGFAWVASTQFVIVFCSVLLLTFRAGFHDVPVNNIGGIGQKIDESEITASSTEDTSDGRLDIQEPDVLPLWGGTNDDGRSLDDFGDHNKDSC